MAEELRATAGVLAESELVGIEVGELESADDPRTPPRYVEALLDAIAPLLAVPRRVEPAAGETGPGH